MQYGLEDGGHGKLPALLALRTLDLHPRVAERALPFLQKIQAIFMAFIHLHWWKIHVVDRLAAWRSERGLKILAIAGRGA